MSAFQLPDTHIAAIARFIIDRERRPQARIYWRHRHVCGGTLDSKDYDFSTLCDVLAAECYRSVKARYPQGPLPGPISAGDAPVVVTSPMSTYARLRPVDVLKACASYAYQACETDDWPDSEAHAIIEYAERAAIRALPGYDASPCWDIDFAAGEEMTRWAEAEREQQASIAAHADMLRSQY